MKLTVTILLAASSMAAAFAPMGSTANTKVALRASFENEAGVMAPTGFWDPANLCKDASQETFDSYREAELKHGRVCMLGICGYVYPEIFGTWPGNVAPGIAFEDVPRGIQALEVIPSLGWMQMFFLIGAVDYYGYFGPKYYPTGTVPGLDPAEFKFRRDAELAHGRTAMLGMLELLRHNAQDVANGVTDFSPFYFPTYKAVSTVLPDYVF